MKRSASRVGAVLALAALGCETPAPEPRCRTRETEAGVITECRDGPDAEWSERALEEAQEGFEERGPERRP